MNDTFVILIILSGIIVAGIVALLFVNEAKSIEIPDIPMNEDQFRICNWEDICVQVTADNLFTKEQIETIENALKTSNNLDAVSESELVCQLDTTIKQVTCEEID